MRRMIHLTIICRLSATDYYIDVAALSTSHVFCMSSFVSFDCGLAVVIYDWSLTFPDEVRLMWRNKLSGAKVLYFLNRYSAVALFATTVMSDNFKGVST